MDTRISNGTENVLRLVFLLDGNYIAGIDRLYLCNVQCPSEPPEIATQKVSHIVRTYNNVIDFSVLKCGEKAPENCLFDAAWHNDQEE